MITRDKILITGGGGFIGEHVGLELLRKHVPHGVICMPHENLPETEFRRVLSGDLFDYAFAKSAIQGYSTIIHLAGRTGAGQYNDPAGFVRANVETTANLFNACKDSSVKRIIVASSYEAYGKPLSLPLHELQPLSPISPYGITMTARENLARVLGESYGIDTIILRLFTVYGEAVSVRNRKGAIATFIKLLKEGGEPKIIGSLEDQRDYLYVKDAVNVFLRCAEVEKIKHHTMNVCTGHGTSMRQVLTELSNHFTSYRVPVDRAPSSTVQYPLGIVGSAEYMEEELGYSCRYPITLGINDMIAKWHDESISQ